MPRLTEVGHDPRMLARVISGKSEVVTMKELLVGNSRYPLVVLLSAVSLVLLIAWANVTSLFVVRAEARSSQRTLRAALGASNGRLARHAFAEAILLTMGGALAGMLLAALGTRALVRLGPASIPRLDEVGMGSLVWLYAAAVSFVAALAFTLVPMWTRGSPGRLALALSAGRNATAGPERLRLRSGLVATQVALAVVLMIASGLVARSYGNLRAVDPGFDPADLVTFGLLLPAARYTNAEAAPLYQRLVEDLRALPGVEAAAVTRGLPVTPIQAAYLLAIEGYPDESEPFVVRWVTPGYFETVGIPVIAGRTMESGDANEWRMFINAAFAERFWTPESAIGKRMGPGRDPVHEVVGVVGDDRIRGLDIPIEPAAYVPIGAPGSPGILFVSVVVRTSRSPDDIAPELRRVVARLDPALPLIDIQAMDDVIAASFAVSRTSFLLLLLGIAAAVSLTLGAVGIYGVIAYVVTRRTPEIGLRLALGAEPRQIWSRVIGRAAMPAAVGIVAGIVIALVGSRVLSSLLFQTSPRDVTTFVAGPVGLLVVALAACVVPARQAISVDPARALRSD
jgi:putative ABC transport system permease protein